MLRDLNQLHNSRRICDIVYVGVLAEDIPLGFDPPALLENDIDVGDPAGCRYWFEILTGPSVGTLATRSNSTYIFTPPEGFEGTASGTQRVSKFSSTARISAEETTYEFNYINPLTEVSSDLVGSYGIVSQVISDFTGSYQVLETVSSDLAAVYALISSVSSDLSGDYGVQSQVGSDLAAAYSIISQAGVNLSGSYAIISALSSDLAGSYVIAGQVSSDLLCSYDVESSLSSVSSDLAGTYAIVSKVNSNLVGTFGIVSQVSSNLVCSYSVGAVEDTRRATLSAGGSLGSTAPTPVYVQVRS